MNKLIYVFSCWLGFFLTWLTHWGRVTHMWISKLTNIGSDNGLSPGRRQAIIWTNPGILLIRPLGTNFIGKCGLENDDHFVSASMCYHQCTIMKIATDLRSYGNWTADYILCFYCPACRTTLVATRFRVAVICPIIQVPHCIRVFFYFVWFVFINHIFQFYHELYTYCNILDIYLS